MVGVSFSSFQVLCAQELEPATAILCRPNKPKCYTIKMLDFPNDKDPRVCCNDFILSGDWVCLDDCKGKLPQAAPPEVSIDNQGTIVIDGEIIGELKDPEKAPHLDVTYTTVGDFIQIGTSKKVDWELRKNALFIEGQKAGNLEKDLLEAFNAGTVEIKEILDFSIPNNQVVDTKPYVFPNPSMDGQVKILFSISEPSEVQIGLFNVQGQLVQSFSSPKIEEGLLLKEFHFAKTLSNGVYFLHIKYGSNTASSRVVLSR